MALTRTTADAVLKEFYLPGVRNILNNEVFLLSQVEPNSEDIEGRRAVLSVNTGRNAGIGARAESGTLPTAGQQRYAEERVTLKYNYGRIQISGPTMRSMGSDRGSFTRAVQSETTGVVRDLKSDVNRQLYGDGSGTIAALTAAGSSTTVTLLTPTVTQKRQIQVGMVIDIGPVAGPATGTRTIQTVNTAAGTFTIDTAIVVSAGDVVRRAGVGPTDEISGLTKQIAASGVLWNIDPAAHPDWASYAPGTGGAVAEDMYITAQMEVNIRSGEEINLWISDDGVYRSTGKLLTSIKRFPVPLELHGGWAALDMSSVSQGNQGSNTVALTYDKDCPTGVAFGLCTKRFQFYRMSDWEFMDEDGAVLNRVPNTDAYEATLFMYGELATDGRNAHAKLGPGLT